MMLLLFAFVDGEISLALPAGMVQFSLMGASFFSLVVADPFFSLCEENE